MRSIALSVIAGALLLGASTLTAARWEISAQGGVVYRLDRWTGSVTVCNVTADYRAVSCL
jgi:hypothetical protein